MMFLHASVGQLNQYMMFLHASVGQLNQYMMFLHASVGQLNQYMMFLHASVGQLNQYMMFLQAFVGELNQYMMIFLQAFLSELYVYLLDQMHVGLNKFLLLEDESPIPEPLTDVAQLKLFAREAEVNENFDLAAKFYQEVRPCVIDVDNIPEIA